MHKAHIVLVVVLLSAAAALPTTTARAGCTPHGGTVPSDANTTRPSAPFFVDTTGLDLRTTPPTRDPRNPAYPSATELPDGQLPSPDVDGNFIIGPTHVPAAEATARTEVLHGTVRSFIMASSDSLIYQPGVVRDDAPGCQNEAINTAPTA